MKLYEYEGKEIFRKYNIAVPGGALLASDEVKAPFSFPVVLKAQVLSGKRKAVGGILFCDNEEEFQKNYQQLYHSVICGEEVKKILVEEKVEGIKEFYLSFSYDTKSRGPALAFSVRGGSFLDGVSVVPVDIQDGITPSILSSVFEKENLDKSDIEELSLVIECLWKIFSKEYVLVAEINPLIKTVHNKFVAGDAKVILDDAKVCPTNRRFLDLGGDIAVLASGGGGSLLNIDTLIQHGGRPANYTEYSGNPSSKVVKELTKKVFSKPDLKGCWVIGGTANFTDIYETMKGFIEGLRELRSKPSFPIVIRRDGPRQKEAFKMLSEVAHQEGYQFYLFDSTTAMEESARIMVKLAYS